MPTPTSSNTDSPTLRTESSLAVRAVTALVASFLTGAVLVVGYFGTCFVATWVLHLIIGWTAALIVVGVLAVVVGCFGYFLLKFLTNIDNVDPKAHRLTTRWEEKHAAR